MKFRIIPKITLAALSICIFTGCFEQASEAEKYHKKSVKKLTEGDTTTAKAFLKESIRLDLMNAEYLKLYSQIILKQNKTLWVDSQSVREPELREFIETLNMTTNESVKANEIEIAKLLVASKRDSVTTAEDIESIYNDFSYTNRESGPMWGEAFALYEIMRDPTLIGVDSADKLRLFADLVYNELRTEFRPSRKTTATTQQQMIDMVLTAFKSKIWNNFEKTENFAEVKTGLSAYEKELKEFEQKAREMGTQMNLSGGRTKCETEYLNRVITMEFESFLTNYSDSLPHFKEALSKAEDKSDIIGIFSVLSRS